MCTCAEQSDCACKCTCGGLCGCCPFKQSPSRALPLEAARALGQAGAFASGAQTVDYRYVRVTCPQIPVWAYVCSTAAAVDGQSHAAPAVGESPPPWHGSDTCKERCRTLGEWNLLSCITGGVLPRDWHWKPWSKEQPRAEKNGRSMHKDVLPIVQVVADTEHHANHLGVKH